MNKSLGHGVGAKVSTVGDILVVMVWEGYWVGWGLVFVFGNLYLVFVFGNG
jgi:hypothetical protein